jgi:hypothetical protein
LEPSAYAKKYHSLMLSLIRHPYDHFDASSGLILFDQGLITCQPLESNISLIKYCSYWHLINLCEIDSQSMFMKVKSHWNFYMFICIKILAFDIDIFLVVLEFHYFGISRFTLGSPLTPCSSFCLVTEVWVPLVRV